MEGYQRESTRTLIVERAFEWSRLEDGLMKAAYESVMPFIGLIAEAEGEEIEPDQRVEGKQEQRMIGA